jgi:type I restriction enzyme M protein
LSEVQGSLPLYNGDIGQLEKRLWESADQLRANSHLSASEYSNPVLGLIFLRYADHRFTVAQQEIENQAHGRRRRVIDKDDFRARGVMYLSEEAQFSPLRLLCEASHDLQLQVP